MAIAPNSQISIALAKGRIFQEALPILKKAGITLRDSSTIDERKLILDTSNSNVRLLITRSTDVPTYVAHGAAIMGIVGSDVLMEKNYPSLYAPLDLGIARCRMVLAGLSKHDLLPGTRMRVATKYVATTQNWFAERGQQIDVVKLYGSMELAPLTKLADRIVDLVDTGNTLRANGLMEYETIATISARLVINKTAYKLNSDPISEILKKIQQVCDQ